MLNIAKLQYMIYKAIDSELGDVDVRESLGNLVISLPVAAEQRATITIAIRDCVYCVECEAEIVTPNYQQNMHDKCKELANHRTKSQLTVDEIKRMTGTLPIIR